MRIGKRTSIPVFFMAGALAGLACVLVADWALAADAANPGAVPKKYRRSRYTHDQTEATVDRRKLLLTTGEDRVVDVDFDVIPDDKKNLVTANPSVVYPQVINAAGQRKQLVFKPLKAGETTVSVRDEEGNLKLVFDVKVTGSNLLRQASEIRSLLRDIEGIDIRVVGQKIVVDGEVLVPSDYARLLSVSTDKAYADLVMNLTTISPLTMVKLAERIQQDINTFAQQVKVRVVNGMIFLEGTADSLSMAQRAGEVAKLYLPEVRPGNPIIAKDGGAQSVPRGLVYNFIVVNEPPKKKQEKLVRVTVHFVELAKDYNRLFGFKWQPTFTTDPTVTIGQTTGGATGATSNNSFTATISSLFPKLLQSQKSGFARVLKTGTVMVRSGQPAELTEGTEFAYTLIGADGKPSAASKSVGLSIAATPQILGQSEDIQMQLDLKQVNLVGRAPSNGGAPTVANHNVKTSIYVKNGESAAVAAVTSSDVGTDFNKDAPGGEGSYEGTTTDPLFSLLHSKAYRKKRSQFVIFITPQIVENASEGTEDLKKNFKVKVK